MKNQTLLEAPSGNSLLTRLIPRRKPRYLILLLLATFAGLFTAPAARAQTSPVSLSLGMPGAALLPGSVISTGIPIINDGTATATHVKITTLTLMGSTLSSPTLPFSLGSVGLDGAMTPLFASFINPNGFPGGQYALTVGGTYKVGSTTYSFSVTGTVVIPAAAPGSAASQTVAVAPNPTKGPFSPEPPSLNAEDADIPGWVVPIGPIVPATPSASTQSQNQPLVGALRTPASNPPGGTVEFLLNQSLGNTVGHGFPTEPSGASAVNSASDQTVVFITANSDAVYSVNGGTTFTKLNPTTIFPNNLAGGFCCDQIVQYVPSIDRFVWLMQFSRGTVNGAKVGNEQRLAVASPAAIIANAKTAWTYWDLTSADFGLGTNWMDYPDLAVGTNNLYVSFDAFGSPGGLMVLRIPLTQLKAGGTINIRYTHPGDSSTAWGSHLTQNTGNEIFWAGNKHTSGLRVFSWPESSTSYSWTDVPIFTWSNTGYSSITPTPGVHDWMTKLSGFPNSGVIGATRSGNDLWMAWSAGTDSNFPQPHVEMVDLDIGAGFTLKQQVQIWNSSYAFAYPALFTAASTGEIGLSLEYGGNGNFENHVVGFWGDFLVYITTSSSIGTNRFGDYVTIRRDSNSKFFDAFGYGLTDVSGSGQPDVHFVIFGR